MSLLYPSLRRLFELVVRRSERERLELESGARADSRPDRSVSQLTASTCPAFSSCRARRTPEGLWARRARISVRSASSDSLSDTRGAAAVELFDLSVGRPGLGEMTNEEVGGSIRYGVGVDAEEHVIGSFDPLHVAGSTDCLQRLMHQCALFRR